MNLSLTNKASFFILFFITILLTPLTAFSATEEATDWLDEPINLSFQNEPLSNVLKQISQQTGISIAYDQTLANEKVSGNYQDVKTSDAITRLFRSKNKSIQVNKEKKIIIVKIFGAKKFIWAKLTKGTNTNNQASGFITLADIEKMHTIQINTHKERIANSNEISEDGIPMNKIIAMQEEQYRNFQIRLSKHEEGQSWEKLRAIHNQQYIEYQNKLTNDTQVLESGMTRTEARVLQEQQYKEYQKRISSNSNTELLEGAPLMTTHEITVMQEQQQKEMNIKHFLND